MAKWMIVALSTLMLSAVVVVILLYPRLAAEDISPQEAEQAVISMYGGQAERTVWKDDNYRVEFIREDGLYVAIVNGDSGQVESLQVLEAAAPETPERLTEEQAKAIAAEETGGTVDSIRFLKEQDEYEVRIAKESGDQLVFLSSATGEIRQITPIEETPEPEPVLTEAEAIDIAKKTLDGEVQDITFANDSDGGTYLVEIENDELDKEVTVQIHAVRGETLTVEWDD